MYQLHRIKNIVSGRCYIGMTKNNYLRRFSQHFSAARRGLKSPLYDAIRKYGEKNFSIEVIEEVETKQECCKKEIAFITNSDNLYNLASGGEGGFTVSNLKDWKEKLSKARQGRKPALGMKHTEENKKFFSECVKRKRLLYDVTLPNSFKEAKQLLGISKTHYYRLVKRAKGSDLS